jgi:hypothetical protein
MADISGHEAAASQRVALPENWLPVDDQRHMR